MIYKFEFKQGSLTNRKSEFKFCGILTAARISCLLNKILQKSISHPRIERNQKLSFNRQFLVPESCNLGKILLRYAANLCTIKTATAPANETPRSKLRGVNPFVIQIWYLRFHYIPPLTQHITLILLPQALIR